MGGWQFTRRAWLAGMAGTLAGTAWPTSLSLTSGSGSGSNRLS